MIFRWLNHSLSSSHSPYFYDVYLPHIFSFQFSSVHDHSFDWFLRRILIRAAEGSLLKGDGEIQKIALQVLCNCVCAPKNQVFLFIKCIKSVIISFHEKRFVYNPTIIQKFRIWLTPLLIKIQLSMLIYDIALIKAQNFYNRIFMSYLRGVWTDFPGSFELQERQEESGMTSFFCSRHIVHCNELHALMSNRRRHLEENDISCQISCDRSIKLGDNHEELKMKNIQEDCKKQTQMQGTDVN